MASPTRVVIIGAGWSGLIAASNYLKISRHLDRVIDITILDDGTSPGGVWEKDRLYPGLCANSPNGLFEYSSMSMVDDEHKFAELLPAQRVQEYLEKFARREGIFERIRFGVHVKRVWRRDEKDVNKGWYVEADGGERWECEKLIVATGLYSRPSVPELPRENFEGTEIHSKLLGKMQQALREDEKVKNVVVVGGCNSAVDASGLFLPNCNPEKKFKVSWVVRPSEHGVPMVVQDMQQNAKLLTAGVTRLFGCLSPSIFWTTGFWYSFLHSGRWLVGTLILELLWLALSWSVKRNAKYKTSRNGKKIEPKAANMFYDLNNISLVQKNAPFLDYLHRDDEEVLKVYRVIPVELRGRELVVADDRGVKSTLPCDLVIWCTGWLPGVEFLDPEEASRLGVPVALADGSVKTSADQPNDALPHTMLKPAAYFNDQLSKHDVAAEQRMISLFPMLGRTSRKGYPIGYSGFRLYRQILPTVAFETGDRSIVFSGMVSNAQTSVCSELTSLWAIAWLEGLLPKDKIPGSQDEADRDVELVSAWMRGRYGVKGTRDPQIVLEIQSYFDLLCRDLDLPWERKKIGKRRTQWDLYGQVMDEVEEWTTPYTGKDYEGVVEEFLVNICKSDGN